MNINVYPTKASALRIVHPISGPLKAGGAPASWLKDGFTARRLTDGTITENAGKAYTGPANPLPVRPTAPPAQTRPAMRRPAPRKK